MQTLSSWKSRLHSWGYEPLFCSVGSKRGLDTLAFTLRDQTSVIVGPSGVGKSSLINALRSAFHPNAVDGDNWFLPVGSFFPFRFLLNDFGKKIKQDLACESTLIFTSLIG